MKTKPPRQKKRPSPRPERGEYLMSLAIDVAARCNCRGTVVGAVIVQKKRMLCATGYNGTVVGFKNCIDGGCPRCAGGVPSGTELDRCVCVHAEQNALLSAARLGLSVEGAECWVTTEPCLECTKSLIQARIGEVHFMEPYPLPRKESHRLRIELRNHAAPRTRFKKWKPDSNVLGLKARYKQIKARLAAYVAAGPQPRSRVTRPRVP